jgi:hypothetical protein
LATLIQEQRIIAHRTEVLADFRRPRQGRWRLIEEVEERFCFPLPSRQLLRTVACSRGLGRPSVARR